MSARRWIVSLLVLLFVITGVVVDRRLRKGREWQPDVNRDMPEMTNEAVQWAAQKKVTLDFSADSIERVEGLLAEYHE
jgi:hypothetical protein